MTEKKRFLLRLPPELHAALEKWAADELRSVNGQLEFLVREALRRAGRLPAGEGSPARPTPQQPPETGAGPTPAGSSPQPSVK